MAAYSYRHTSLISPPPLTYPENAVKNAGPSLLFASGFQPLSCLRCAHRKVRCDRLNPCSKCTKHDVLCEFPPPKTEKRRRRKTVVASSSSSASSASNNKLHARIDRYEEILKGLGVDVESISISNSGTADFPKCDMRADDVYNPQLEMIDKVVNGHIEGNLWTKIGDNLKVSTLLPGSSDDEDEYTTRVEHGAGASGLALGLLPGTARIDELYPPQQHFSKLWQIYLDNIQPIIMILHAPSTSVLLDEAVKGSGHASKDAEVLLFAVMACALISITDAECIRKLGEKRSALLSRYQLGCELTLINAKFLMSTNLGVLQAYMIYLFAVGPDVDPRELWNLIGIAKRSAQRLGLHQEKCMTGLTPFEVEMRRRLWSQIVMYDAISAQAASLHGPDFNYEITAPSNVNDSDLSPTMKEPPKERTGATDMILCNLRYKIIKFVGKVNRERETWGIPGERLTLTVDQKYRDETEKAIEEMEKEIELDILRYCDTLNPVHFLTAIVARLTLCKLRFTMFHPSQYKKHLNEVTTEDREFMFSTALRVLEYENNAHSQPSIQGFLWHTHQDFQWSCVVHILEDLKTRLYGEQAERAWEQIRMLYQFRPTLYQGRKQKLPLYTAINKMTIEAWRVREIRASEYGQVLVVPTYITMLREQEQCIGSKQRTSNPQPSSTVNSSQTSRHQTDGGMLQQDNLEQEAANWTGWPNFNTASSNPGLVGMHSFDPMSNLNQEVPMSIQNYIYDPSQSQNLFPPLAWTGQGGDNW